MVGIDEDLVLMQVMTRENRWDEYHAYIYFPVEWLEEGTYRVDGYGSYGYLEYADIRIDRVIPLGLIIDADLVIEEVETESGATFRATIAGDLYALI